MNAQHNADVDYDGVDGVNNTSGCVDNFCNGAHAGDETHDGADDTGDHVTDEEN